MKETQSEIAKSENAKYSLSETLSNRSDLNFETSNVKYYNLKDLIDSDIETPTQAAVLVEEKASTPLKADITISASSISKQSLAKHLPRQPPKPRLAHSSNVNTSSQYLSTTTKESKSPSSASSSKRPIFKSDNVATLVSAAKPLKSSNSNKLESASSYSWLSPQIHRSKTEKYLSNPSLPYSPILSNQTESIRMSSWSNSEKFNTPPPQFNLSETLKTNLKSFSNNSSYTSTTTTTTKAPVKIITDPIEIASIDNNDKSFMRFEISEVRSMKDYNSLDDLISSMGLKMGFEENANDSYSEISEIILIF